MGYPRTVSTAPPKSANPVLNLSGNVNRYINIILLCCDVNLISFYRFPQCIKCEKLPVRYVRRIRAHFCGQLWRQPDVHRLRNNRPDCNRVHRYTISRRFTRRHCTSGWHRHYSRYARARYNHFIRLGFRYSDVCGYETSVCPKR